MAFKRWKDIQLVEALEVAFAEADKAGCDPNRAHDVRVVPTNPINVYLYYWSDPDEDLKGDRGTGDYVREFVLRVELGETVKSEEIRVGKHGHWNEARKQARADRKPHVVEGQGIFWGYQRQITPGGVRWGGEVGE